MTGWNPTGFRYRWPSWRLMLGRLVMSAAVPAAFDGHALVFGGIYVAVQVGRTLFFIWALRGHHLQARGWRVLFSFSLS